MNQLKNLTAFIDERQQAVTDDVNRITNEYVTNGERAAINMLNDLILVNGLKVWEASALESKVCRELTKRGVFTRVYQGELP